MVAIDQRPALRRQMGSRAYQELMDAIGDPDSAHVNSIWVETLFPQVLAWLRTEFPRYRAVIGQTAVAIERSRYHGQRLTREEQRMTGPQCDTQEEARGER